MSWRSPLIVPITAVLSGTWPDPMRSGSSSATAAFMARALMSISGTKISWRAKRSPTTPMASVIESRIVSGGISSRSASSVTSTAVSRSPTSTATCSRFRSAIRALDLHLDPRSRQSSMRAYLLLVFQSGTEPMVRQAAATATGLSGRTTNWPSPRCCADQSRAAAAMAWSGSFFVVSGTDPSGARPSTPASSRSQHVL